jgi:hypothetical protein
LPEAATISRRVVAACVAAICLRAMPSTAQSPEGEPDPASVRVRIGPLWLNPTISLNNIGVDDNVFNDPSSKAPKKDFTFTVTPATDIWLHVGPSWVTGNIKEDVIWFQQYSSERSANNTYTVGWRVPLSRLTFKANTTYANSRERPGFEIDARAQRTQLAFGGAVEVRALSRTYFGITAARERVRFADDATFRSTNLHDELNRVGTSYGLTVREQVTTLTAITLTASRAEDRFEFSPLRDSRSTSATAMISFDPQALIKGSAAVGYTNFEPQEGGLAGFRGITSTVNLSYTLLGATKFAFTANRAVQYSYDVNQPYYLQTGFTGSIAQQIFGPVDVVGRVGRQTLDYRDREGVTIVAPNRTDRVTSYGGGVGYHLGKSLRLGFNIDNSKRTSPIDDRSYQGLRYGTALTYGT